MNTPADRDYINAKAEAIAATLSSDAKEYQTKMNTRLDAMNARLDTTNARLDALEQTIQSGFQVIREELTAKLAQSQAELIKWIAGTVLAGVAISTSITAVLLNNSVKATAPTPIVIYAQPNTK
jgi:hypothetical protein